ncbi:MAG: hypothetical protein NDJ19_10385 [Ramlibacter sp.]|nr:hypothetical protein [Ramlibacter sp.]
MNGPPQRGARAIAVLARLALACLLGLAALSAAAGGGELRSRYGELREQLRDNNFHRPLYIVSSQDGDTLRGDIYAVLDHPFAEVGGALKEPADWCDILILPFNTKYCRAAPGQSGASLSVRIGRRSDQPVQEAFRLEFALRPVAAAADYFESRLDAGSGPMGTRDYRIVVAAVPLDARRTFMHLSYSYGFGALGRLAMQAYLATAGAGKVGFSVAGRDAGGEPVLIGGVRGAIERNVMRYYLAIDAHLASLSAPPGQRLEKRIGAWFDASERYPRQLREMDRASYFAMKRQESRRQQTMIE